MNIPHSKATRTEKVVLKAIIGLGTRSNNKAQGWYLNCGSSEHVCYSRDMFVDYNRMRDHEVILDNDDHLDVAGIGTVVIRFDTYKVLTLSNVLHIPKISKCYVSVAKLDDLGYITSFVDGIGVITKSHEVIGKGYNLGDCVYRLSLRGDLPMRKVIANEHPGAVSDHEVTLDNDDHAEVARIGISALKVSSPDKANDSGFSVTFGGGQCVIKQGDVVVQKGYKDDVLYKMDFMKEPPPLAKVEYHETGLLMGIEHPELTKARARGWYLLARCKMHICNSRDMFVDYQPVTGHEVVLEDNSRVDVVGYGTVKLQLTTGKVLTLERVFHMPAIMKCCISVKMLKKMGFSVGFDDEGCYVKKGQEIVGNGFVEDGLFRMGVIDEGSGGNQA